MNATLANECPPAIGPRGIRRKPEWTFARVLLAVLALLVLASVLAVVGVTSYLRLGAETTALRRSATSALPGQWNKEIAVNVGWFTTSAIRAGSHLFNLPPEAAAALRTLHSAEVGVYTASQDPSPAAHADAFACADASMKSLGWDRIVGVREPGTTVAVYFPSGKVSPRKARFCVMVLDGRELVVVSATGNLKPLAELAHAKLKENPGLLAAK